jgi:prepilin-type processing-associated H-X9-DG protein
MLKRDAIVLVVLCGLVVLCAGAGRMHAKLVMCDANLKSIGEAMRMYCDSYDGKMPTLNPSFINGKWVDGNCIHAQYVCSMYDASATPNQVWLLLGCLLKAGLVSDGRTLYCPSAPGYMDEYLSYSNPAPWGSNLPNQMPNINGTGNIWLRITKGYIYWPQSTTLVTAGYHGVGGVLLDGNGYSRYKVGQPAPPYLASQLDPARAMVVDGEAQKDESGKYKVNALFGDGHIRYQLVPQYSGKWICPYQGSRPSGAIATEWYSDGVLWDNVTLMSNYMYLLQP